MAAACSEEKRMNRPYTVCYLNVSAEAHIDGDFGKLPEAKPGSAVFRSRWHDFKADAIVYGATTMAMFAAGFDPELPKSQTVYAREDSIVPCDVGRYYIAISPYEHIAYESNLMPDIRGRGIHGIIHALTENVSDDYLAYLREKRISYIFCGRETFDPVIMMRKAYELFGIQKAILSGGAYADWTLPSHGLIDEIQIMYLPVVDGDPYSNTLFKRMESEPPMPVALKLVNVQIVDGDGLLVTYRPKNIREEQENENRHSPNSVQ